MKKFKVPFAYKEGKLIDIHSAKKGEIYKCNCGQDLKLRGGEIISNHFYHINNSECSLESLLHKAYKTIFSEIKMIKLPYEINGMNVIKFDSVEIEQRLDNFQPDAIGYLNGQKVIIEFAKTSYIGNSKEKKIKKANLLAIEVHIPSTVQTLEDISDHLLNETYYKYVIHIPEYHEMKVMREKFKKEYNSLLTKVRDAERKLQEYKDLESIKNAKLFYKLKCRNGALLYKSDLGSHEIGAFVTRHTISLYIKKKWKPFG